MSDLTCPEVEEAAAEYALGILPRADADAVAAHLPGCAACSSEVEELSVIGDRILDLIPDTEPPVGFDRKVLASWRRRPGRRRTWAIVTVAPAVILVVTLATAALTGHSRPPQAGELTGFLRDGGRTVGTVYVGGDPAWVTMTVQHAPVSGRVTCQLVGDDGATTTVGYFQLVDGSGTWSAPDPGAATRLASARLIGPGGDVLAVATLGRA
jgi:hypothetical protein